MGNNSTFFRNEKRSLLITFVAFDLGYLARYIWDEWYFWTTPGSYAYYVFGITVIMTDGITLLILILLHRKSFVT